MLKTGKNSPATCCIEKQPYLISAQKEDRLQTRLARMMHMHDDRIEILQLRSGHGIHIIDGQEYETKQGDILVYNAGVPHEEMADAKNGMDILSCAIGNVSIKGLAPNVLFTQAYRPVIQDSPLYQDIGSLMSMLFSHFTSPHPSRELEHHLLCSLLLLVRNAAMGSERDDERKQKEIGDLVQRFIDEHYQEEISLQHIAQALHMSPYYLSHAFKRTTGYTPMNYVTRRRIGEAQSRLLSTDHTVTDIAYAVGYSSASNFHNAFKKMIGLSPQKYREFWRKQL
ncbi:AraC family transcriptional regulator [Domibacillus enclensis]|uniref:AraC family transcriptional regulator n=1 Tax=Domibacillus enclensis TaxID=1017273 RepID=A0A1N6N8J2_9BACI|nr:AraC family transcriptional regulator [Domibacillus enclensis]OXS79954.1 AraC family transcriptional regulator [Domibacillus enclensis]SIP88370.1 transcriptional regulator, AraC family [Domibacillus enclensis]